jgi:hypothetical protein
MSLESDLAALQSLPSSVLQRLIDPSAPAAPPTAVDARAQLSAFDPSNPSSTAADAVAASRAYVGEMRRTAEEIKGAVITERDLDGARLEKIRGEAEVVRAAVREYADKTKSTSGEGKCELASVEKVADE